MRLQLAQRLGDVAGLKQLELGKALRDQHRQAFAKQAVVVNQKCLHPPSNITLSAPPVRRARRDSGIAAAGAARAGRGPGIEPRPRGTVASGASNEALVRR